MVQLVEDLPLNRASQYIYMIKPATPTALVIVL